MKRSLIVTSLALAAVVAAPHAAAQRGHDPAIVARVDALVARMTVEEKVGQMTQLTIGVLAAQGSPQRDSVRLDPARLREAIVQRHVGSLLNVIGGSLTLEGWHGLIGQIQNVATRETRLGIPVLYGIDFVHGANYTRGGTLFPHNLGLAATFDVALARRAGEVTGDEALASGLAWNFAPVLDVGRQPLFPRFYETFGEDPLVASMLGRAAIEGMQRTGRVSATLKHYLAYSAPRTGRDRTPASVTPREVREIFLPPFAQAVRAGARAVMVNSGEIDGEPVHASRYWLTEVLRGELGFDGVIVTDWEDIYFLHTRHRVAPTIRDAVRMAIDAGIDMSMTPNDYGFTDALIDLVRDGVIPESRIDAVRAPHPAPEGGAGAAGRTVSGSHPARPLRHRGIRRVRARGGAPLDHPAEERGRHPSPAQGRAHPRHRPRGQLAHLAQRRVDVHLAGDGRIATFPTGRGRCWRPCCAAGATFATWRAPASRKPGPRRGPRARRRTRTSSSWRWARTRTPSGWATSTT